MKSGLLDNIQQLSIRMYYGNGTHVDYLQALRHLRQLLKLNFRIYWSRIERSCILQNNAQRTMCYDIDMVTIIISILMSFEKAYLSMVVITGFRAEYVIII
jgi:hypothetical protein